MYKLQHQIINSVCPRFAYVPLAGSSAGSGHNFGDIIFGINLALVLKATFVLQNISGASILHGRMLDFSSFGIDLGEHRLHDVHLMYSDLQTIQAKSWKDAIRLPPVCRSVIYVKDNECFPVLPEKQHHNWCFHSLENAYDNVKWIMRLKFQQKMNSLLHVKKQLHFSPGYNVAWHIRIGDINLHANDESFFLRIHDHINSATQHLNVPVYNNVILSGDMLPKDFMFLRTLKNFKFLKGLTIDESIMHFAHADLLVESGSSFPMIAHVISSRPIVLFTCVHGLYCKNKVYPVSDAIVIGDNYSLPVSAAEFQALVMWKYEHYKVYHV